MTFFNTQISLIILAVTILTTSCDIGTKKICHIAHINSGTEEIIRVNQLGYLTFGYKEFFVANTEASMFQIINKNGTVVYEDTFIDLGTNELSGEKTKKGYFSNIKKKGIYIIYLPEKGFSYPFQISDTIYQYLSEKLQKGIYFQRAGTDLPAQYASKWNRPYSIPDTLVYKSDNTIINAQGGWINFDQYDKHVIQNSLVVAILLNAYEQNPTIYENREINIPETFEGNDLLKEIKWGLDWLLKMQDNDGGVFSKIISEKYAWNQLPHQWNNEKRLVIDKSTASTLHFAASFAKAAYVFQTIDPKLSQTYANAAIKAWNWAAKNSSSMPIPTSSDISIKLEYNNTANVYTWAAVELYKHTNNEKYLQQADSSIMSFSIKPHTIQSIGSTMATINLHDFLKKKSTHTNILHILEKNILSEAKHIVDTIDLSILNIPTELFLNNSNQEILHNCLVLCTAYSISHNQKHLHALTKCMDYLLGVNATGYSFVTGIGHKYPRRAKHIPSFFDKIKDPIPGLVINGPCKISQYKIMDMNYYDFSNLQCEGPAKMYADQFYNHHSNRIDLVNNALMLYCSDFINKYTSR